MSWDSSTCRVCSKSEQEVIELRLKADLSNDYTYLDLFNLVTRFDASLEDELPIAICYSCSNDLFVSFEFLKRAMASDQYFKSTLEHHKELKFLPNDYKDGIVESISVVSQKDIKLGVLQTEVGTGLKPLQLSPEDGTDQHHFGLVFNSNDNKDCIAERTLIDCNVYSKDDDSRLSESRAEEIKDELKFEPISYTENTFEIFECEPSVLKEEVLLRDKLEERSSSPEKDPTSESAGNGKPEKVNIPQTAPNSLRAERGKTLVICCICNKMLKRWSLKEHMDRCHNKERLFLCSACPRTFAIQGDMKTHMKIHDKKRERKFLCDVCKEAFYTKASLNTHMILHTGEKKFQCTLCDKKFLTKDYLRLHEFTHNRQLGKFICQHCDKRFVSNTALTVHERFHTGSYPFKCDICEKSYAVKSHFNYHMDKHRGVTYKCDDCDKVFTNRGSLCTHKLKHRDKMPHQCSICLKGFITPFKLNRHLTTHKPTEETN